MSQQQLDRIVELLNKLRVTDPQAQKAWETVTWECCTHPLEECGCIYCDGKGRAPFGFIPVFPEASWPDGAVRGMLEEVVETLWPGGSFPHGFGYPHALALVGMQFRWGGDAKSLATVLIEALEEKVNASPKA